MPDSCLPFGRTLTSGTYEITESFRFVAPATESALKIADGATVTLDIAAGVEVMLKGGDAVGMTGAGAGIEVPEGATLRIGGVGYLIGLGSIGLGSVPIRPKRDADRINLDALRTKADAFFEKNPEKCSRMVSYRAFSIKDM